MVARAAQPISAVFSTKENLSLVLPLHLTLTLGRARLFIGEVARTLMKPKSTPAVVCLQSDNVFVRILLNLPKCGIQANLVFLRLLDDVELAESFKTIHTTPFQSATGVVARGLATPRAAQN